MGIKQNKNQSNKTDLIVTMFSIELFKKIADLTFIQVTKVFFFYFIGFKKKIK